jgi:Tol biopolymer transport system component
VVPLTSYPGREFQPSFSPDGSQVVFIWERDGSSDIYIKQIGVEEPTPLTRDSLRENSPAWSPDGLWIAFWRILPSQRVAVVRRPQRGGPEQVLAEFARIPPVLLGMGVATFLAWAPDSKALVISARESEQEPLALFVLPVDGGEKRRLTSPAKGKDYVGDASPAVSPDGRVLVFSRHLSGSRLGLYRQALGPDLTPRGTPVRLLPDPDLSVWSSAWTSDGSEIVFAASDGGKPATLWRMSPAVSAKRKRRAFHQRAPLVPRRA